jgi:hypothetical protein
MRPFFGGRFLAPRRATTWETMTGATTSDATMTASGTFSADTQAWKAHNGVQGNAFDNNGWGASSGVGAWLQVEFAAQRKATSYTLWHLSNAGNASVTGYTLAGSNNGASWTTLSTIAGNTALNPTHAIASPGAYYFYRITVTSLLDSVAVIPEWNMAMAEPW